MLKLTRYGSPRCEHFGFSIQVSKMWLGVIIFIKPYKNFISFHVSFWTSSKLNLTFTKWGGVACETTSVHGPQCNFRLRNTTSVHSRQLPSTSSSPQYLNLIHCFQHEWAKKEDSISLYSLHFIPSKFFLGIKYFFNNCSCSSCIPSFKLLSLKLGEF